METRVHSSKAYSSEGQTSRIMLDLSGCSENFKHRFQQRQSLRLRNRNVKSPEWRQNLHVGVIGAGLAGLRCADILIEEGINVTILEARDRLGGRVSYR